MTFNHPVDIAHFLNTPSKQHEELAREMYQNIEENNIKKFKHIGGYVTEITLLSDIYKFRDAHLICQAFYALYNNKCNGELVIDELPNNIDNQKIFNIVWSYNLYEREYYNKKITYNRRLLIIIWLVNLFLIGTLIYNLFGILIYNFKPIYAYLLFCPTIFGIVLAFTILGEVHDAINFLNNAARNNKTASNRKVTWKDDAIQINISNGEVARNDKVVQNNITIIYGN